MASLEAQLEKEAEAIQKLTAGALTCTAAACAARAHTQPTRARACAAVARRVRGATDINAAVNNRQQYDAQLQENTIVKQVRAPRPLTAGKTPPPPRSSRRRSLVTPSGPGAMTRIAGARAPQRRVARVQAHWAGPRQAGSQGRPAERGQAHRVHPKRDVRTRSARGAYANGRRPLTLRGSRTSASPPPPGAGWRGAASKRIDKSIADMEATVEKRRNEVPCSEGGGGADAQARRADTYRAWGLRPLASLHVRASDARPSSCSNSCRRGPGGGERQPQAHARECAETLASPPLRGDPHAAGTA